MIRKLTPLDRNQLLNILYQEPEYNIFPIGDVEAFGVETPFQRVYGEFNDQNQLLSILLRYKGNAVYYANALRFNQEYLHLFTLDPFEYLSGKSELLDLIAPHLTTFKFRRMYLCKADHHSPKVGPAISNIIQVKTREDCIKLYHLLVTINEFGYQHKSLDDFIDEKLTGLTMGQTLAIEQDGIYVATAATTAETKINAMVVAVATHRAYRHQGYATILIQALMAEYLLNKKKSLCLFYDNPEAGEIYLRAGFTKIGTWDMSEKIR